MSRPSAKQLASWRAFIESAFALIDILDAELQAEGKITIRWYDALVHLEEAESGLRMHELASRILASRSGLTRVMDRMEEAGLVRRERPEDDRRAVQVFITPAGTEVLERARVVHRRGIQEHFLEHLGSGDLDELTRVFAHVRSHVRPLRPGRVSG